MIDSTNNIEIKDGFYAGVTVIAGKRGQGKSWTAGVIVEEAQNKDIPFIFIDPQHANLGLAELPNVEIIRTGEADPKRMAKNIAERNQSVLILPEGNLETSQEWVAKFLRRYMEIPQKAIRFIAIDEAHLFAPNSKTKPPASLQEIIILATTKRSDGLGLIVITQRFSEINQTVINQEDNLILHKFAGVRDMMVVQERLKHELTNKKDLDLVLRSLKQYKPGETLIISDHITTNKKDVKVIKPKKGEEKIIK